MSSLPLAVSPRLQRLSLWPKRVHCFFHAAHKQKRSNSPKQCAIQKSMRMSMRSPEKQAPQRYYTQRRKGIGFCTSERVKLLERERNSKYSIYLCRTQFRYIEEGMIFLNARNSEFIITCFYFVYLQFNYQDDYQSNIESLLQFRN